ncbi:S-adenosyl-L-methionine-dependent methyltransferase [Microthyrium microscopicum]|uniref:S-adenosyl-L-methionine-dependent methyltransferase n=1 Tax=Microthyrium microscopicum TaxID=703497 RepID=A0A6A6UKQ1_9PEZI|nr:S-adenosyl-L-methionine-dependent methyltransferase [Microthyrium microscopicum]
MADGAAKAEEYESQHVHQVYEEIAHHFSATRYKPWPIIAKYLQSIPSGSVGVDVGCGNGKNMTVNSNIFIIGSDRSESLVKIAADKKSHDTVVGDILDLPHPLGQFDFAICIAVVHHLSTRERRVQAVGAVLSLLKQRNSTAKSDKDATALIYVWALEQKNSRRGWDEGGEQDVMVPWVKKGSKTSEQPDKIVERYYHLYRKGELEEDIREVGGEIVESGYEKDNWWAIARRCDQRVENQLGPQ